MKTTMKIVLGVAVILIIAGAVGGIFFGNNYGLNNQACPFQNGVSSNYMDRGVRSDYMGRGMTYDNYSTYRSTSDIVIPLEDLEDEVNSYINQYGENLEISDIFVFEDSDYYFSIIEEDTGFGAMELLVNQYSGDIYPEFGPNMMWNLKYGMHGNGGYGMIGGRGMMGRNDYRNYNDDKISDFDGNDITKEEAQQLASDYIKDKTSKSYSVSAESHEFYGYYTFHIEEGTKTLGMLSVNGFSGEVWYHDWHGTVTEIIGGHESEDTH